MKITNGYEWRGEKVEEVLMVEKVWRVVCQRATTN